MPAAAHAADAAVVQVPVSFTVENLNRYDFAAGTASLGHASVIIDRLGFGTSPKPNGFSTCYGAQADMAHQIVLQLRSGSYRTGAAFGPVSFARVAIGGHGPGALVAGVETYSFGDVVALVSTGWSDNGFSDDAASQAAATSQVCAAGGQPKDAPNGPPGYLLSDHRRRNRTALLRPTPTRVS